MGKPLGTVGQIKYAVAKHAMQVNFYDDPDLGAKASQGQRWYAWLMFGSAGGPKEFWDHGARPTGTEGPYADMRGRLSLLYGVCVPFGL